MKNYKSTIISLVVFIICFFIAICFYTSISKPKFVCTDVTNNKEYTFDTKEEMDAFCDTLSKTEDEKMTSSSIYYDLINNNDSRFSFYPYIDGNNKFTITVVIVDCQNPSEAKNKAIEWFQNHSYNINDYNIEFEYPCG